MRKGTAVLLAVGLHLLLILTPACLIQPSTLTIMNRPLLASP